MPSLSRSPSSNIGLELCLSCYVPWMSPPPTASQNAENHSNLASISCKGNLIAQGHAWGLHSKQLGWVWGQASQGQGLSCFMWYTAEHCHNFKPWGSLQGIVGTFYGTPRGCVAAQGRGRHLASVATTSSGIGKIPLIFWVGRPIHVTLDRSGHTRSMIEDLSGCGIVMKWDM